jgi:NitT/TauT family transport system substrate-binding protein
MIRSIAALSLIVVAVVLGLVACAAGDDTGSLQPVVVAYSPFESSGLFLVACDRQLFARHGLDVTLYRSDSGAAALDDMLNGQAELAVSVAEFPLVRAVLSGTSARAVATIDKAEYIYVIARQDMGIAAPTDLAGKRIGAAAGSIAEFHLGRFLVLHGLSIHDVEHVSIPTPAEAADAVVNGDLPAAVLAQPYAAQAAGRLGANALVWPAQSDQPLFALVVATGEWLAEHPERMVRFVRALAEAEEYMSAHPAEARAIVQRWLDFDAEYAATVWEQNQFLLSLDQALVAAMEDEARWLLANGLTTPQPVPDFLDYIYRDALETVKPEAVNLLP